MSKQYKDDFIKMHVDLASLQSTEVRVNQTLENCDAKFVEFATQREDDEKQLKINRNDIF